MMAPYVWRVTGLILTFLILAAIWWFGAAAVTYIWPAALRYFDVICGAFAGAILFHLWLWWFR
jgi:uncharacterized membrane protein YfbV (UPF0208 family)